MLRRTRQGVPALAVALTVFVLAAVPALAAGKTVHITKSDSAGNAVQGATFTLYVDAAPVGGGPPKGAEDTVVQGTCTTGANGQCDITDVPPGNYWVSETGPPAGYAPAADSTLEVKKGKKKVFEVVVVDDRKPANTSVNDPTGDELVEDGTHIFQFGPSVAVSDDGQLVGVAFNDSTGFGTPGGASGVGWAFSEDGGATFTDLGKIPTGSGSTYLLAQPSVVFDPASDRFIVASSSFVVDGADVRGPILVSIFDPTTRTWLIPVNTYPEIPPAPFGAHDQHLVLNPLENDLDLTFTLSNGSGQAEGMFTRSPDGGHTWNPPVSVTGPGTHDFMTPEVAPNGNLYVTWTDFGSSGATANSFLFSRSDNGGATWSPPVTIAGGVPKSGSTATCGASQRRTYLGEVATQDAPRIAVDPFDATRIFVAYPGGGGGGDEGDVFISVSEDGGQTWDSPSRVLPSAGTQMFPDIGITPDGRIGVGYYHAASAAQVDFAASFFDVFFDATVTGSLHQTLVVNDAPFPLWNVADPYDTAYSPCFGMQGIDVLAPGSGFFLVWADGGDPGPAGNNGVDPNIELAHVEGPFLVTSTALVVASTATRVKVTGVVSPAPPSGAPVTIALFVDEGHGFDLVARRHLLLRSGGVITDAFRLDRSVEGTCRVTVDFPGSEGRMPSSASKTFAC